MKLCKDCVHAVAVEAAQLIRCDFPLPIWVKREMLSSLLGGELADHVNGEYCYHNCPTYQPREERETQP
jgi:hypothetical protein